MSGRGAAEAKNLLLFGCDFFANKKASEINFWQDMVALLRHRFREIIVLSVNNRRIARDQLYDNVHLYNVAPHYLRKASEGKDEEYSGKRFHQLPLATVYKTYSFVRYLPVFNDLIAKYDIGTVHYMRVFGLMNRRLIDRHSEVTFSITVPTHVDRGFPFHHAYHAIKNAALRPMDKVIATSKATHDKLQKLGIDDHKLEVIPWTVHEETGPAAPEVVRRIRAELGIPQETEIVLWSGPLQGTGSNEFDLALEIARRVTSCTDRFTFIFALKPDYLAPLVGTPPVLNGGIRVLETDRGTFSMLKAVTSAFLSPVCNMNRTVAPPLTWIEMMGHGIPVITTPVAGAEELIANGDTGFIVDGASDASELLMTLERDSLERMAARCSAAIAERYNIQRIADRYVEVWTHDEKRRGE